MTLTERVPQVLFHPREAWATINSEPTTPTKLFKHYIAPLAAIPPLCMIVGWCVIGISVPFSETARLPILSALAYGIFLYAMSLLAVYLYALVINILAPAFGGTRDFTQALKVAGYAMTAIFVAGVAYLIPILGMLVFLAMLYGLYVLYVGLLILMKAPVERSFGYTLAVIVVSFIVSAAVDGG